MLSLATITATANAASTSVRADLEIDGTNDPDGQEVWAQACLQFRPPADTEAIVWRRGDEAIVMATKNRTYEIGLSDGEVVLTAMVTNPVSVKLTAAGAVEVGKGGTLTKVTTLTEVKTAIDAIQVVLDAHVHSGVTTGAGSSGPLVTPVGPRTLVGSPVLKADA
jgi:hypothetical protein